jgi:hypothetical protein
LNEVIDTGFSIGFVLSFGVVGRQPKASMRGRGRIDACLFPCPLAHGKTLNIAGRRSRYHGLSSLLWIH